MESVYKVVEIIGTSPESWGKGAFAGGMEPVFSFHFSFFGHRFGHQDIRGDAAAAYKATKVEDGSLKLDGLRLRLAARTIAAGASGARAFFLTIGDY